MAQFHKIIATVHPEFTCSYNFVTKL